MKKIFFVTSRLPYPPNSGRKNVMYNYCKILNEKYGYEVVVASFLEDGDSIELKPKFINKVYALKDISSKKKLKNILKYTIVKQKFPLQVSLFWDEEINNEITDIIETESPDIVMADMVRTTEYLKNSNLPKIADLDDMISIRYKRQSEANIDYLNPYGAYLYSLPEFLQKILKYKVFKKLILDTEIRLLKKYEIEISKIYNNTVFVAEREANILNKELGNNKALAIPLGVDMNYYGEYYKKIKYKNHTIAFLGAMSVAHNESAVIHFIKNIFPHIVKKIPDVKFYIIGGGVTNKLKSFESENIIFTGRVEDVREYVGKCQVFVCPLIFGSGIKTKNLEAMAMGVPIVTTSIGAENIHAIDNKEWLVADNEKEFANKVILLMNNIELYERLQENAYKFVEENFTWKVAEEKFSYII